MAQFSLSIELSKSDTQALNTDDFVVAIVIGDHNSNLDPKPLWVVLSPFEKNTVTWDSDYGVYGSPDPVTPETVITASSTQYPASSGVIYPFENNEFNSPGGSVGTGEFAVENKAGEMLTFGLAQRVTANGLTFNANPISAIATLPQEIVTFQPTETVSVFVHNKTNYGVVTNEVEGPVLLLDMTFNPTQTIHYSGPDNEFLPGPLP